MNKLSVFFISFLMLVLVSSTVSALSTDFAWMDYTDTIEIEAGATQGYYLYVQPDTFILDELKIQGSLHKIVDNQEILVNEDLFKRYPTDTYYEEFLATPSVYDSEPGEYVIRATIEQRTNDGGYKLRTRELFLKVTGEIEPENLPPYFTSTPVTSGTVDELYYYDARAVDPESDPIEYALVTKPSGMTINKDNGVVSWTPNAKGTYTVKISVTDNINAPVYQEYQIVVDEKVVDNLDPYFTSTPVTEGIVGEQYYYDAKAVGPEADDVLTYSLVRGPSSMQINPQNGVITWTPSAKGVYDVKIKVVDNVPGNNAGYQEFVIIVDENEVENSPPIFTSVPSLEGTVGEVYTYDANAVDVDLDVLKFSLFTKPAGMTINEDTGVITWIPTSKGAFFVKVAVTDNINAPVYQTFAIAVKDKIVEKNLPPYFTSTPITEVFLGDTYLYDSDAVDPENDVLEFALVNKPAEMMINKDSGALSWLPGVKGIYDVTISVTDNINDPVYQSFKITVKEKGDGDGSPKADFYWSTPVYLEELVTLTSNSTDSDGSIVSEKWSVQNEIKYGNPITHRFTRSGFVAVTLTVTDNDGKTDSVAKYVEVMQRVLEIDHFSCNEDVDGDGISEVVHGEELMCVAHIKDDVSGVTIQFDYNGDGNFEECVTDFKGQCSSTIIVNDPAGIYDVYATATKPNWKTANAGPVKVEVWEQRYSIRNLQVFEDVFETEQDTFYRKTPMYVSFDVYDDLTNSIVVPGVDENVLDFVYLKVAGSGVEFDKWTKPINMKSVTPDYSNEIRYKVVASAAGIGSVGSISGIDDTGLHKFVLDEIPITDDFLGEGKVFAFTFNFTDRTAGEATKNVNILNNELTFNPPLRVKITPGESITMDMTQYVSDIETPVDEVKFTYGNTGHLIVNPQGIGNEFKIYADVGQTESTTILFTADDTDGSVVTRGIEFYIDAPIIVDTDPVAILTMPKKAQQKDVVVLDGSKSYDTNEGGYLTDFAWTISLQNKIIHEETGLDQNLLYQFDKRAIYDVTLTVTDNDGNKASATNTIEITELKEEQDDADTEDGIWVDYFDIYGTNYGTLSLDEPYYVTVKVRNERSVSADNIKVTFSLPELGYQDTAHNFNLRANGDAETVNFGGYLPFTADEVPEGEYIALITVKTGDILRVKYYPLYIE